MKNFSLSSRNQLQAYHFFGIYGFFFFQYSHADWLLSFVHTSNESIHS